MTMIKSTRKGGMHKRRQQPRLGTQEKAMITIKIEKVTTMIKNIRKCENNDSK
jgi:hypothetical protein